MLRVMSGFVDTSLFALNIATALSLGLAVDYALLLVSRYREELDRAGGPTEEAHRRTVRTAGRTALFSGFTVAVALAPLMTMPQRFLYSVGAAGAAVGLLSALMAILVVPALLALLGPRINALPIRLRRGSSAAARPALSAAPVAGTGSRSGRMRRPIVVAVGCTALLLAAASPLLSTAADGAELAGGAAGPAVVLRQRLPPAALLPGRGVPDHRQRAWRREPGAAGAPA